MRWPAWVRTAPALVAESLRDGGDPLAAWLKPGPPGPCRDVAAALARALLPEEASDRPPAWLRADQALSFRRAVAAAQRFGGTIVADPVGTGKTFIGLAAAAALAPGRAVQLVIPAALRGQWLEAARKTGLEVQITTHESVSRGGVPSRAPGAVVIDESHRFRNAETRRYRTLAPWLAGRRAVLLTATPAVNRLADVGRQLLLVVRDDALSGFGVESLTRLESSTGAEAALARVVVTGDDRTASRPERRARRVSAPADQHEDALLTQLDGLTLSRDRGIAALVRISLLAALASSSAALLDALSRYRLLLQHAVDALAAGRTVDRGAIRRFTGPATDQLVLWELVDSPPAPAELSLDDLSRLDAVIAAAGAWSAAGDARARYLEQLLADDERPTLVFCSARATVGYLRRRLRRAAWCTGSAAGIGVARIPRDAVLRWFRANGTDPGLHAPRVLVATDVAAEGLDLSRVERVVHFDLPWTDVRLAQREGRALRLGAGHDHVDVVRLLLSEALEGRLRRSARIASKAGLRARLGLDEDALAPWRTSAALAQAWDRHTGQEGVARVTSERPAVLAGFRIHGAHGETWTTVAARVEGAWRTDLASLAKVFAWAERGIERRPPDRCSLQGILEGLAPSIRNALRAAHRTGAAAGDRSGGRLRRRLQRLAERAARRRDRQTLDVLDRGLRLLERGRTAGEDARLTTWSQLGDRELLARLRALPIHDPPRAPVGVSLVGVLVLEPA